MVKKKLTNEATTWIIRPVSDSGAKRAVFQFNPDKAPGLDGFSAHFFQKHWSIARKEITIAVKSFFSKWCIVEGVKSHTSHFSAQES